MLVNSISVSGSTVECGVPSNPCDVDKPNGPDENPVLNICVASERLTKSWNASLSPWLERFDKCNLVSRSISRLSRRRVRLINFFCCNRVAGSIVR